MVLQNKYKSDNGYNGGGKEEADDVHGSIVKQTDEINIAAHSDI